MDGKNRQLFYQRQGPKVQQRSVAITQQEGNMDVRLGLRLEMIRDHKERTKKFKPKFPNCSIREDGAKKKQTIEMGEE